MLAIRAIAPIAELHMTPFNGNRGRVLSDIARAHSKAYTTLIAASASRLATPNLGGSSTSITALANVASAVVPKKKRPIIRAADMDISASAWRAEVMRRASGGGVGWY